MNATTGNTKSLIFGSFDFTEIKINCIKQTKIKPSIKDNTNEKASELIETIATIEIGVKSNGLIIRQKLIRFLR